MKDDALFCGVKGVVEACAEEHYRHVHIAEGYQDEMRVLIKGWHITVSRSQSGVRYVSVLVRERENKKLLDPVVCHICITECERSNTLDFSASLEREMSPMIEDLYRKLAAFTLSAFKARLDGE